MAPGILKSAKYSSKAAKSALAASAAANKLSSSLGEPLLPKSTKQSRTTDSLSSSSGSDDSDDDSDDDDESVESEEDVPEKKMSGKDLAIAGAVSLVVAGSVAAAASAMVAVPTAAVFLMGGVSITNSPSVVVKHLKIAKSVGLRESISNIREEVNLLTNEVDFLEETVDDLVAEAQVLKEVEQGLQEIAEIQGENVNEIIRLVNENEEILNQMKANMRQTFACAIANVVMRSDKDGDMTISLKEAPILALRLQMQIEPYGIKLDAKKFEDMLREDNDIGSVIKFCANLVFGDEEEDDEDDGSSSVDSDATFDFEDFCKKLDDEEEGPKKRSTRMTMKEKLSMVTVDDKYSKGSVDVARGKRMTLMPADHHRHSRRQTIMKEVRTRQTRLSTRRSTLSRGSHSSPSRGTVYRGTRGTVSRGAYSQRQAASPPRTSRVTFQERFSFAKPKPSRGSVFGAIAEEDEEDEETGLSRIVEEESPRSYTSGPSRGPKPGRGGPTPGRGRGGRGLGRRTGFATMERSQARRRFSQLRRP